jgi:hypothetical protein
MIRLLQWPPTGLTFPLLNELFVWRGDEPFIEHTDPLGGWIGRIQRYGRANQVPENQWDTQTIFRAAAMQLPESVRGNHFHGLQTERTLVEFAVPEVRVQRANPPPSLVRIAKTGLRTKRWGADADANILHAFGLDDWLKVLRLWNEGFQGVSNQVSGPVWWYALHAAAMNHKTTSSPSFWVSKWIRAFPCKECRNHFSKCPFSVPPTWEGMEEWADKAHNWVTENK